MCSTGFEFFDEPGSVAFLAGSVGCWAFRPLKRSLAGGRRNFSPTDVVDVLQVAAQVAALSKVLAADIALIWALHCVLSEVITQIAALSEYRFAALILASEVQLGALGLPVVNLDRFMPLFWYALKLLRA